MTLKNTLRETKVQFESDESLDRRAKQTLAEFSRTLVESNAAGSAVKRGQMMPDFTLPSASGRDVRLSEIISGGPALVVFYRGKW